MWIIDRIVKPKASGEAKGGEITQVIGDSISAAGTEEY